MHIRHSVVEAGSGVFMPSKALQIEMQSVSTTSVQKDKKKRTRGCENATQATTSAKNIPLERRGAIGGLSRILHHMNDIFLQAHEVGGLMSF